MARSGRRRPGLRVGRTATPEAVPVVLPLDFITQSSAILAMKRVGKSNAAVVIAEEVYLNGLPFVVIDPKGDWFGIRGRGADDVDPLPGLEVLIIGGPHADLPVQPTKPAAVAVAQFLVEQRTSAVIDVSGMDSSQVATFCTAFFTAFYNLNVEPVLVIIDEADQIVPERSNMLPEQTRLVHAVVKTVKQGGFKGIGTLVITQRAATLNKSVLTQVENLIALRTASPGDKRTVGEWLDNATGGKSLVADLPSLGQGEAIFVSPYFLPSNDLPALIRMQFSRRRTADTGSTPKIGETRAPVRLADLDLTGVTDAMQAEVEKAEADDPSVLRREVARLQREVSGLQENVKETIVTVEVPTLPEGFETFLGDVGVTLTRWQERVAAMVLAGPVREHPVATVGRPPTPPQPARPRRTVAIEPGSREQFDALRAGARRMVTTLVRYGRPISKANLGALAEMKPTSGTWSTYLGEVRAMGLVTTGNDMLEATDAAYALLPEVEVFTDNDIVAAWRRHLRAGANRMLDVVKDAGSTGLTRSALAQGASVVETSGTFSTYLGEIVRTGLVQREGTMLVASPMLLAS